MTTSENINGIIYLFIRRFFDLFFSLLGFWFCRLCIWPGPMMGRRTSVISQLELSPVELELLLLLSNARRKTRGEQIKYFTQHRCIIIIRSDFTRKTKTLKQFHVIQFGSAAAVAHKRDLRQPDKRRNRKKEFHLYSSVIGERQSSEEDRTELCDESCMWVCVLFPPRSFFSASNTVQMLRCFRWREEKAVDSSKQK